MCPPLRGLVGGTQENYPFSGIPHPPHRDRPTMTKRPGCRQIPEAFLLTSPTVRHYHRPAGLPQPVLRHMRRVPVRSAGEKRSNHWNSQGMEYEHFTSPCLIRFNDIPVHKIVIVDMYGTSHKSCEPWYGALMGSGDRYLQSMPVRPGAPLYYTHMSAEEPAPLLYGPGGNMSVLLGQFMRDLGLWIEYPQRFGSHNRPHLYK